MPAGATIGYASLQIIPSMKGVASSISKQLDQSGTAKKAGESVGKRFSLSLGTAIKVGAVAGTTALGGLATAAGLVGLKTAAAMEQADISFTTMLGSAEKARKFLGQLQQFAASTPFSFPELQTAASSLVSAGINARDVIPIMRTLGDVTSGMGTGSEGVQRATIALQQMSAAGRITGEDLNQLRDAGIPVYDLLANATGKSKAQVVALAQAGKLGAKELGQMMEALKSGKGLERFSGLMEKQSQSLSGLWSSLQDNVQMALSNMVKGFFPIIKTAMPAVLDLTAKIGPSLTQMGRTAGAALSALSLGLRGIDADRSGWLLGLVNAGKTIRNVFLTAKGYVDAFLNGLKGGQAFGSGPLVDVTNAAGKLRDAFIAALPTIKDWAGRLRDFATTAGPILLDTLKQTASTLATVTGWAIRNRDVLIPLAGAVMAGVVAWRTYIAVTKGIAAVRGAIAAVRSGILLMNAAMAANPIGIVVVALAALGAGLYLAYKKSETFRNIVNGAWAGIKTGAKAVADWFTGSFLPFFTKTIPDAFHTVVDAGKTVAGWFQTGWAAVVTAFDAVLSAAQTVGGWFQTGWAAIKTAITAVGDAATWLYQNAIKPAFDGIVFAGKLLAVIIGTAVIGPMVLAFRTLGYTATVTWRGLIKPAFDSIAAAAKWLWNNGVKPTFDLFMQGLRTLGSWFTWLWRNAISPAVTFIRQAIYDLGVWERRIFDQMVTAIRNVLGAAFTWLRDKIVTPVWNGIKSAINTAWSGIKILWGYFTAGLQNLANKLVWLRDKVVTPVWNGIKSAISTAWNGIKAVFGFLTTAITVGLHNTFVWLRDKVITPVWNTIKTTISNAWTRGIKPAFDLVKKGVGAVGTAFGTARDAIKTAWDRVANIARKPINFVISQVYNRGVVGTFNSLADKVGLKTRLATLKTLPAYARGGVIPGTVSTRDNTLIAARTGEAVMVPEFAKAVGGASGVNQLNAAARSGQFPGFKDGGVVGRAIGGIKGAASDAWDFLSDAPGVMRRMLNRAVSGLVDKIPGGGMIRDAAKALPAKMIDTIVSAAKGLAGQVADTGGGGLGPGAPGSSRLGHYKGKTFTQAMIARIMAAERRYGSGFSISQGGFRPSTYYSGSTHNGDALDVGSPINSRVVNALRASGIVAWMRSPAQGPWGWHIHGIPVPGGGVRPSPAAIAQYRSYLRGGNGLGGYDQGGVWPSGTLGVNASGSPEAVFNAQQWRTLRAVVEPTLAGGGAGGQGDTINIYPRQANLDERHLAWTLRAQRIRERAGRPS